MLYPLRSLFALSCCFSLGAFADPAPELLEQIEVQGRQIHLIGDILELVPGMVVTQHSSSGKANQYFLRGFNLDHGTDFFTRVDGMPVNMRSHGHGQGYTDLNFIIPETLRSVAYQKDAYYADVGDFSGAGSATFTTATAFDQPQLAITTGSDNYYRLIALGSHQGTENQWLYALELQRHQGP